MSDLPPAGMTGQPGAPQPGAPGEPSEEEVRQYLSQMRSAPAEQVVAEVLQGLLNAAQVKLGRRDARLLLDAASDLAERTGPALSDDLRTQLGEVLSQLRMGQVQAEREVAESGHDEPNDLVDPAATSADVTASAGARDEAGGQQSAPDADAAPPSGRTARPVAPEGQPGQPGQPGGGASPLDKLWIPGR